MTTATRIYIARLAGLTVFDPNGDQVGRVRDAVARIRADGSPPRVVGLIAELALRRGYRVTEVNAKMETLFEIRAAEAQSA